MAGTGRCAQTSGSEVQDPQLINSLTVASAAHALKNPLEAMLDLVYLLKKSLELGLQEQLQECAHGLEKELERMRQIVNETLGNYREPPNPALISLSDIIDTILRFYDHKIAFKHIQVDRRYECDGLVKAFSEDLRQLFSNLVINALEALRLEGRLTIHIYESQDWCDTRRAGVRVVIADNGSGILREQRQRVFSQLFTTKGQKGTGLGLWVSAQIVHKHEGSIRFRSSTKRGCSGAVFSVFLPATADL